MDTIYKTLENFASGDEAPLKGESVLISEHTTQRTGGGEMKKPFDIFWFGEDGPTWIEAVDTLEIAKAHIEKLPQANSGSYAVMDQRTGNRISFAAKIQISQATLENSRSSSA